MGSKKPGRHFTRLLEMVRFILNENETISSHLDPSARLSNYLKFRRNILNDFTDVRYTIGFNWSQYPSKKMRVEILRRMVVRMPP